MPTAYVIHIAAGVLSLVGGYVALYSAKGAPLHRRAGMVFVYAMLAMCGFATLLAAVRGKSPAVNIPSALLTASLVITGLTTVRTRTAATERLDRMAMIVMFAVAASVPFLAAGFATGIRMRAGQRYPLLLFGIIAGCAAIGDWRVLRAHGVAGAARLKRHLWRMSYALFVASGSFFLGQAKVIPASIRIPALLALPVLAVLATMAWWLWRLRRRGARYETLTGPWPSPSKQVPNSPAS